MAFQIKNLTIGLLGVAASTLCSAQVPAPEINHHVAGWMLNRPVGTLEADWFTYSDGSSTAPSNAAPALRYDAAMIEPKPMVVPGNCPSAGFCRVVIGDTLLALDNVPADGSAHIDYPFTTVGASASDIVLNQAGYTINNRSYGTNFEVRAVLVDSANVETQLTDYVSSSSIWNTINSHSIWDAYYFVRNPDKWPLAAANAPAMYDQGALPGVMTPVPLHPGNSYKLRLYFKSTDGKAMVDDVILHMQAVTVTTLDDGLQAGGAPEPDYSFAALTGGTTPTVLLNDQINAATVPSANSTLALVSADAGLTLDTATGTIAVAPGQPGTKKLTYSLCPKYEQTILPTFQSTACKTAVATVTLTGPGIAVPAGAAQSVPSLHQYAVALLGLLLAGLGMARMRKR